ncbi:MAG TPA: hypothetical protein DCS20_01530, partial [Candidatus Yonathbacteria bacterium]|nr:hypothetical protein [Candidatus Yonathbacteria bacterium]
WKKDLILRTLDGNLHYIYGQTQHATEQDAKDAALPSIPTAITNGGSAYLATAVVQNGDTTLADRLYDIRPNLARVFGFGTSGTTGSIATHSALSGLGADDHTQYLLTSGARAMAGNLNLGTNAITGLTTLTATGLLQTTATTEQMRLRYDASNYTSFTVGSTGALTIGTTGTGTTTITNGVNVGTGNGYYIGGASVISTNGKTFGVGNVNTGTGAVLGSSNTGSSNFANAVGMSNTASGFFSNAFGYGNTASAFDSSAFGFGSQATSSDAVAFGFNTSAGGADSVAMGNTVAAYANGSIAIGKNITNTTASSLMIGPSDAAKMTILSSGNVGIGTTSPYAKLSVVGEVVASYFTATSTTATSTFANHISVAAGKSYRIGGIPVLAYDSSTGMFNVGANTNTSSGVTAGTDNTSSNIFSSAFGSSNTASGSFSNAFGYANQATSSNDVAFGYGNNAGGGDSGAFGHYNNVYASQSVAIGYGITNTTASSLMIGPSDAAKLTILSSGNVGIGTTSPYAKLSVVGQVVADYFTATSTTATSTFTAGVNVGSGNGYFVNGASAVKGALGTATTFGFSNTVGVTGIAFGNSNTSSALGSAAFGLSNTASSIFAVAFGNSNGASGTNSVAMGYSNIASAANSIAIGKSVNNSIADSLQIGASNTAKLTIRSSGNMGIGTTSPYTALSVVGEVVATNFTATTTTATSTILGKLAVGYSQASASVNGTYFTGGLTSWMNNVGVDDVEIGLGRADNTTATAGSMIFGGRSRGTLAAPTAVTSGDTLLTLQAVGHDGTDFAKSSAISFEVDGTPGANDMPGRIVFSTSADGAQAPIERMRIKSTGNVGIGTTSPTALLHVYSNQNATANSFTLENANSGAFATTLVNLNNNLGAIGSLSTYGSFNLVYPQFVSRFVVGSDPDNAGGIDIVSQKTTGDIRLYTGGTATTKERVRILSNGNVGIGTTSPYAKLSVVGEIVASYITATSTTATSTFANHVSIASGKEYRIDGAPVLSTNGTGGIVGFGNSYSSSGVAMGKGNAATNAISVAVGYSNTASGAFSSAVGGLNTASDTAASAIGYGNSATSSSAVAIGYGNNSGGASSVAMGKSNSAYAATSIAIGSNVVNTIASSLMIGPSNTAKLTILSSGNTGIGTTTPFSTLTVGAGNIGAFNGALCADNGGLSKCYGTLTAGVVYGDSSSFVASDIAENYPVADTTLEAGDIVMVASTLTSEEQTKRDNDKEKLTTLYQGETPSSIKETIGTSVEKATIEGGYKVIGVISTAPGVLLGDTTGLALDTAFKPVALSGRVPLKVNNEGGGIKAGDPIALSTTPGVGTKATTTSRAFVGTALEDFSGAEGKILVFMNLSSARLDTKIAQGTIGKGQSSFWDIDDSTGRLKYIAALDLNDFDIVNVKAINAIGSKWSIDAFGRMVVEEIKTNKLCVGETCVDESMLKKILEKVGIGASATGPVVVTPEPTPVQEPLVEAAPEPVVDESEPTSTPEESADSPAVTPEPTPIVEEEEPVSAPEPTPVIVEEPAPTLEPVSAPEPAPVATPEPEPVVVPEAVVVAENI